MTQFDMTKAKRIRIMAITQRTRPTILDLLIFLLIRPRAGKRVITIIAVKVSIVSHTVVGLLTIFPRIFIVPSLSISGLCTRLWWNRATKKPPIIMPARSIENDWLKSFKRIVSHSQINLQKYSRS